MLLDAVAPLRAARPELQVVIAGSPVQDKEAYAAQLATRARTMPGVHWVGARADVADLLADLDVFVLPSTQPEPFGLVLVEALASGVPVVATNDGGPVEILDGLGPDAGRLIPPGNPDALASAVCDLYAHSGSAVARRRARPVLRHVKAPQFSVLFDRAITEFSRTSGRWRRGRGRTARRHSAPT